MTSRIQFVPTNAVDTANAASPWTQPKRTFDDRLFKPEYAARRLRFSMGQNWFRIVPAIQPSTNGWMLPIHVINYQGGRFAHPRTLRRNTRSVFDHAYNWAKINHPESLFSKEHKEGIRLLTDPKSACWVIVEEEGKSVARLLLASGYDGTRGGAAGLGYEIWRASRELDENGDVVADAIDPEAGLLICVEKAQAKLAQFPSYTLRMGRRPCPMSEQLARMAPEEIEALCPLENVIQDLTDEEQWQCLERSIAPETVKEIRNSLK